MSRMRARSPQAVGSASRDYVGQTPTNTPNVPRVRVSLPKTRPAPSAEEGEGEEWNDVLKSLIDQKRKSLALLYRSLSNETESQSRLVKSRGSVQDRDHDEHVASAVRSIHINRQGTVTFH